MRAFLLWSAFGIFLASMLVTGGLLLLGIYHLWTISPMLSLVSILVLPTLAAIGYLLDNQADPPRSPFRDQK